MAVSANPVPVDTPEKPRYKLSADTRNAINSILDFACFPPEEAAMLDRQKDAIRASFESWCNGVDSFVSGVADDEISYTPALWIRWMACWFGLKDMAKN
jgi:hypothetical protein